MLCRFGARRKMPARPVAVASTLVTEIRTWPIPEDTGASAAASRSGASRTRRWSPAAARSSTTSTSPGRRSCASCARRIRTRASSRSTPRPRWRCRAWSRCCTGADLVRAGVEAAARRRTGFRRPDGSAAAAPPRHALAHEAVRFVGEAVAAVVAETRDQARATRATRCWSTTRNCPTWSTLADAIGRRTRRWCWPTRPTTSRRAMRHGEAAAATRPSRRRRTWCRSTWSTSGWRRRRWSRARCSPASTRPATGSRCA